MVSLSRNSSRDEGNANDNARPVDLYLTLYQTGSFLLAVFLYSVTWKQDVATGGVRTEVFIYSILGLWGVAIVVGLAGVSRRYMQVRLIGDFLFALALIWWTGGVESVFLPILFANVLASSAFCGFKPAIVIGTTATLVLAVITIGRIQGWSPTYWTGVSPSIEGRESYLISCMIGQSLGIQAVALLGSRLVDRLRRIIGINDLIVQNIGEGLVALDQRKNMILMNEEALRVLGYPSHTQWHGRKPREVFRRTEDEKIVETFERGDSSAVIEWSGPREDDQPTAIRVRQIRCRAEAGDIWLALLQDETLERRALSAEARVRHLEQLEDMAHGLAHEIRNPLGSIRGCVQELSRGSVDEDQSDRMWRIIIRESDRLDRIVADFMEYSRTNPTRTDEVQLVSVLEEVVESVSQRDDAREIQFSLANRCAGEPTVVGHQELIYQVFMNLGVNAVEAIAGSGTVEFSVVGIHGDCIEVTVADDGPGMEIDVASRIFNPFYSTKTREGGLGLSLVEKIVRRHGGTIDVRSELGQGTVFTVWLPGVADRAEEQPALEAVGVSE